MYLQAYDFEVKYKSSETQRLYKSSDAVELAGVPRILWGRTWMKQIDEFIMTVGNAVDENADEQKRETPVENMGAGVRRRQEVGLLEWWGRKQARLLRGTGE